MGGVPGGLEYRDGGSREKVNGGGAIDATQKDIPEMPPGALRADEPAATAIAESTAAMGAITMNTAAPAAVDDPDRDGVPIIVREILDGDYTVGDVLKALFSESTLDAGGRRGALVEVWPLLKKIIAGDPSLQWMSVPGRKDRRALSRTLQISAAKRKGELLARQVGERGEDPVMWYGVVVPDGVPVPSGGGVANFVAVVDRAFDEQNVAVPGCNVVYFSIDEKGNHTQITGANVPAHIDPNQVTPQVAADIFFGVKVCLRDPLKRCADATRG